jgi:hypothetical protein
LSDVKKLYQIGALSATKYLNYYELFQTINKHQTDLRINRIFMESVEKNDLDRHHIFHVGPERGGNAPVGGIFWCDFSSISPSVEASIIPQIFGHTPTRKNGVRTAHGLKLIDVDAGMCRVFGGARVYLEITPEGHLLQHSKSLSKWTTTPLCVQ